MYHHPAVRKPSLQEVDKIAHGLKLELSQDDLKSQHELISEMVSMYDVISDMPDWNPEVKYPRTPGYRPLQQENKFNAWYVKTKIKGADSGILKGKTVAIKDNIPVAGVQMAHGSVCMEGTVPDVDATVVTRVLDAGGEILGKAVCENLCSMGESFSPATGQVLNPANLEHSAGGSSSGCAALVAAGDVDVAIGGDQGGSIRIPAARCGIIGLKPSFGLVPYTGCISIDPNLDYVGPMGRTVEDVAKLLEALAGFDNGLDPRQKDCGKFAFSQKLQGDLKNKKIAVITEGFSNCEQYVQDIVHKALTHFKDAGATLEHISIPVHKQAQLLSNVLIGNGASVDNLFGRGYGSHGYYPTSLLETTRKDMIAHLNDVPPNVKTFLLMSTFIKNNYGAKFYYKAQNLRPSIVKAYDDVLENFDVLVMPTLPDAAPKLLRTTVSVNEYVKLGLKQNGNCCAFNYTGHPALTINAGFHQGDLPIGLMIIGKHLQDDVVLDVASGFERKYKEALERQGNLSKEPETVV